ncbi:Strongly-conserved Zn-finger binding protein (TFIIIA) [Puccinia graminis f. sp. tritici]|uniref:Strongly-conserved Zn-finger binding protein (TFIIIA) n=1 Tax=Puccinia graminis f. sp. tritici TaxID=56615 RepID=A0A5B0MUU7_PUCGR|nr:Strongly-conserved Zn-finger binding protein (TFIIIA) [Puccinia graminis f. sp. tritici]
MPSGVSKRNPSDSAHEDASAGILSAVTLWMASRNLASSSSSSSTTTSTASPEACPRRFWTQQQLRIHRENVHEGKKGQPKLRCDHCPQEFLKHRALRAHLLDAHCPQGTKPYMCPHPNCGFSFANPSRLRKHERTHEPTDTLASITTVSITQASRSSNAPSLVGLTSSVTLVIRIPSDVPSRTAVGIRNHSSLFDRSNSICKSIILLPNRTEREKKKKKNQ